MLLVQGSLGASNGSTAQLQQEAGGNLTKNTKTNKNTNTKTQKQNVWALVLGESIPMCWLQGLEDTLSLHFPALQWIQLYTHLQCGCDEVIASTLVDRSVRTLVLSCGE